MRNSQYFGILRFFVFAERKVICMKNVVFSFRNPIRCHYGEPARLRRRRAGEPRQSSTITDEDKTKDSGRIVHGRCDQIVYPGYIRRPEEVQRSQRWRRCKDWEVMHKTYSSASRQRTVNVAASRWRRDSLNSS